MNLDQAREIFENSVLALNSDCVIVEGATREYSRCFVFFYQSKKFIETGDVRAMLGGNGPVFVNREDGRVFETGSAFPVCHYVKAFETCGDPLGQLTEKVKIYSLNPGANRARAIQSVKEKSEMGLSQAKAVIDNVQANGESYFTALTVEYAEQAVVALKESGFDSVQLWSNQC